MSGDSGSLLTACNILVYCSIGRLHWINDGTSNLNGLILIQELVDTLLLILLKHISDESTIKRRHIYETCFLVVSISIFNLADEINTLNYF